MGEDTYAFDAKFRVERDKSWAPKSFDEVEEVESLAEGNENSIDDGIAKWFKQSDIHKMHTYRDAVRHSSGQQVRSAWAVYPGTEFRFYSDKEGKKDLAGTPRKPVGVGAIPLEPNGTRESLDTLILDMLTQRD